MRPGCIGTFHKHKNPGLKTAFQTIPTPDTIFPYFTPPEPLNVDWDGNELLLSDILGTDEDVIYRDIENEVERKLLLKAIDKLSDREKKYIKISFSMHLEA